MLIDCAKSESETIYKVLLGCVVPRPIGWVSTQSLSGVLNLAPFSFFNAFSAEPPIIGLGIGMKRKKSEDGTVSFVQKDTLANIIETEEFVVNVVSLQLAEQMNRSSGEFDSSINEFEQAQLSTEPSTAVKPPRVKESMVSLECRLFQRIELPKSSIVLGQVICMHVKDEVWNGNSIVHDILQPIGRLGGSAYCKTDSTFEMARPRV
ncbi:MAG: flavin reductase family protein [Candidatus Melainabacteria bacterium]|nr:flavin reductase family protein [Candidatus Melainabacteria bacterium]